MECWLQPSELTARRPWPRQVEVVFAQPCWQDTFLPASRDFLVFLQRPSHLCRPAKNVSASRTVPRWKCFQDAGLCRRQACRIEVGCHVRYCPPLCPGTGSHCGGLQGAGPCRQRACRPGSVAQHPRQGARRRGGMAVGWQLELLRVLQSCLAAGGRAAVAALQQLAGTFAQQVLEPYPLLQVCFCHQWPQTAAACGALAAVQQ